MVLRGHTQCIRYEIRQSTNVFFFVKRRVEMQTPTLFLKMGILVQATTRTQ